ncbi:MAG: ZIP family metal transporter [Cytophagaceae bacterium]|jgi:zinc transporter ZupT|nr:ZIP family metal transporter [Cytophagaceae bacterium]
MWTNFVVLFLITFAAGAALFLFPTFDKAKFKSVLSFSGAYLFAITVVHIFPEIFHENERYTAAAVFVLIGFFMQLALDFFSTGVEHGHIHLHHHDHHFPMSIFLALCVHSFLEGTLLVHPEHASQHEHSHGLMFGLLLHKIPESFALASVLVHHLGKKRKAMLALIAYALCSPLGVWVSEWMNTSGLIQSEYMYYLFATVAGNFLFISTTIFFEASPSDHSFKGNRLLIFMFGAATAVLLETCL